MYLRLPLLLLSCLMASFSVSNSHAAADGTLRLYILTGQSNAEGAVKGAPLDSSLLEAYKSSEVLFWYNNINKTTGATLSDGAAASSAWGQAGLQYPEYNGNKCMGPEYGFSYMMEQKGWLTQGEDNVAIVKVATDGGGNGFWVKGGTAYNAILATVSNAMKGLDRSLYSSIDISGLLYLQGESDSAQEGAMAGDRYAQLLANLKNDLAAAGYEGVTVTLGQSVLGQPSNGNASTGNLKDYAENHDNAAWVVTLDLKKWSGDNLHFSGASQLTIGARYAYNTALLNGLDVGTVRGQNDAALDSAAAWWGDGVDKLSSTVAEWDLSSSNTTHRISDTAGTRLEMHGIRIADTYSEEGGMVTLKGGYTAGAVAPSVKDTTLVIGSGGITVGGMIGGTEGSATPYARHLTIASNVEIKSDQTWSLSGGSSLTLQGAGAASSAMGLNIISGSGNVNLARQQSSKGRAVFKFSQADHEGAGRTWTLGDGVDLSLNQSSSWRNNDFQVMEGADASIGGVNATSVTLGSLTLGDHSSFSLGGSSVFDLSVSELILGAGVSLSMDVRSGAADKLNNLGKGAVNIDGLRFDFNYGSGVNASTRYVIMENVTGDLSSLLWNSQVSSSLTSKLEFVDGNLVLTFTGSGSGGMVWPAYTAGCDALAANASTFNARAASGVTSGTVSTRTSSLASGITLGYYYANSGAYQGDVYGVLDGLSYTWASGTGSGSAGEFARNTLTGSAHVKVTGDYQGRTVNGTVFGAVNATVNGNVYVELDASNITYGQNGSWGSVNGAYNSQINGRLDIVINRGAFAQSVYGGNISGNRSITGGSSLTINGGTFSSVVAGGGKSGTIEQGIAVTINDGTFNGKVYGGGSGGVVNGGVEMFVNGGVFKNLLVAGGNANTVNGGVELTISGGDFSACSGIYAGVDAAGGKVIGDTTITLKDIDDSNTVAAYRGILSGGNQASGATAISGRRTLVLDHYTAQSAGMNLMNFDAISLINGSSTAMTWGQLTIASSVEVSQGSEVKINGTGKNGSVLLLSKESLFSGQGTVALTESGVFYVAMNQLMAQPDGDHGYTGLRLDGGTLILREIFAGTDVDAYANALQVGDFSGVGSVSGAYNTQGSVDYRYLRANQSSEGGLVYSGIFENSTNRRSVGLIKDGVGTLVLTGANTSLADLSVQGGILQLGNGGTTGSWSGSIKVESGGQLVWNRSDAVNRTDSILVNGTLTQSGSGACSLAAVTGSGILQVNSGSVMSVANMNGFSGKVEVLNHGTFAAGGSWNLGDSSFADSSILHLLAGSEVRTGDYATYSNKWTLEENATINVANDAGVMGGVTASSGTLVKSGAGDLSLYGVNELKGLDVRSGSIIVVGQARAGSLSGGGKIVVKGAMKVDALDGYSGRIDVQGGAVDLNGQHSLGGASLNLQGGSVSNFAAQGPCDITVSLGLGVGSVEFNAVTGVFVKSAASSMLLSAGQTMRISNGSSISVGSNSIGLAQGSSAFVIDSTSSLTLAGTLTLDLSGWLITESVLEIKLIDLQGTPADNILLGDDFSLVLSHLAPGMGYDPTSVDFSQLNQTGNVYVNMWMVPEPGTVSLALIGLSGLFLRRRRGLV